MYVCILTVVSVLHVCLVPEGSQILWLHNQLQMVVNFHVFRELKPGPLEKQPVLLATGAISPAHWSHLLTWMIEFMCAYGRCTFLLNGVCSWSICMSTCVSSSALNMLSCKFAGFFSADFLFPTAHSMPLQCHHRLAEGSSFISEILLSETAVHQHQGRAERTRKV